MSNLFIAEILEDSAMLNLERGMNIYHLLAQTILMEVPGDVVELGCCHGNTAILIQKTLELFNSPKQLHVYDSFEGLPEKHEKDAGSPLKSGGCKSNVGIVKRRFEKFNAKLPEIHVGLFSTTIPAELPEKISFVHLDADFYQGTLYCLDSIYPRLNQNAVVVIDDYCDPAQHYINNLISNNKFQRECAAAARINPDICPGVKKACDEFFSQRPEKVNALFSGYSPHGYFRKA